MQTVERQTLHPANPVPAQLPVTHTEQSASEETALIKMSHEEFAY